VTLGGRLTLMWGAAAAAVRSTEAAAGPARAMPYQGFVGRQITVLNKLPSPHLARTVRVVPFDEPAAAGCAAPLRGPTDEERAIYASHRHLQTAEGAVELRRLLALQTRATSLSVKLERDALRAAVAQAYGTYSALTLFWAATVIDANARAGRAKPDDVDLRRCTWPAMVLTVAGKILIPLALLIDSPHNVPKIACLMAYGNRNVEVTINSISYRVGVFVVCLVALWTNYQSIQDEMTAFKFLKEFKCDDLRKQTGEAVEEGAATNAPAPAADVSDVAGRAKKDGAGELLEIFAEVNLLSFKLVIFASILLFYAQNTIVSIVLNSLALQFILQIDVTVVTLVTH